MLAYILMLLLTCSAYASKVIKISPDQSKVIITHDTDPWKKGDRVCIHHTERPACGVIIKINRKGAVLQFDFPSAAKIGDPAKTDEGRHGTKPSEP